MATIQIESEHLDQIVAGSPRAIWSARGDRILRYSMDLRHKGLHCHRELSAPEVFILQGKVDALVAGWDAKYAQLKLANIFKDGRATAEDATIEAQARLRSLSQILAHTLRVNDAVDWGSLKDTSSYQKPISFPEPQPSYHPGSNPKYEPPRIGFFDVILGRKARLLEEAEKTYEERNAAWQAEDERKRQIFQGELQGWEKRRQEFWNTHAVAEAEFQRQQEERNSIVDELARSVESGDPAAVIEHAVLVLENSDYGGLFEKSFTVQYDAEHKLLKVEYRLPSQSDLPSIKSVKFNRSTGELVESNISEREARGNFEAVSYQIALRTLHELYEADQWGNIDKIALNGVVEFVDPRTGREAKSCILSVLTDRLTFESIDLSRVEAKACFKSLKGVSAASLASLNAVAPVLELDRADERFVDAKDVVENLDAAQNLASMSWEDFEHLVRELFEKEFSSRGGEVKITQASRDGGVDAIAFDPDPITGGKIVIQAKRYTRTVGVSAVRDLFGTVMNEGASKGILVTTADYGPDAHQFASGKPLSLLSGSHLLYMLERHGYKAKIDLREAREQALRD